MTQIAYPHDPSAAPFWEVIAVWDPDEGGADFAYTVGLSRAGLPELHVWARPDHGDDPGADFVLSQRDLGHLLNRWAPELLDGRLAPGAERDLGLDDGASRARFVVGAPVRAHSVDAHYLEPDDVVLPVRWSLEREPIGPMLELTPEQDAARARRLVFLRSAGAGLVTTAPVNASVDFGPYAEEVAAAAGLLATADARALGALFTLALDPDLPLRPEGVIALTAARARPVGLVEAAARARELSTRIAAVVAGAAPSRRAGAGWSTTSVRSRTTRSVGTCRTCSRTGRGLSSLRCSASRRSVTSPVPISTPWQTGGGSLFSARDPAPRQPHETIGSARERGYELLGTVTTVSASIPAKSSGLRV